MLRESKEMSLAEWYFWYELWESNS